MSDFDMLLVRGEPPGGFNLSLGSPNLIRAHLKFPTLIDNDDFDYPSNVGYPSLLEELRFLYPNKHIIVANGAKQALQAALYALSSNDSMTSAYCMPPYWVSVPTVTSLVGVAFTKNYPSSFDSTIHMLTSPGNPCGIERGYPCDLLDAVYAHKVFGWSGEHPKHKIMVSSASKFLGLPGSRIGWCVTEDEKLFKQISKYMEISTSGVSTISQRLVANALCYIRTNNVDEVFNIIRNKILENGEIFKKYLGDMADTVQGVPANSKGAFAFFSLYKNDIQRFENALIKSKVNLLPGKATGIFEDGWFRINMLQLNDYTESALRAVKDNM